MLVQSITMSISLMNYIYAVWMRIDRNDHRKKSSLHYVDSGSFYFILMGLYVPHQSSEAPPSINEYMTHFLHATYRRFLQSKALRNKEPKER